MPIKDYLILVFFQTCKAYNISYNNIMHSLTEYYNKPFAVCLITKEYNICFVTYKC